MIYEKQERWFSIMVYFILFLAGASCLLPLIYIISVSFSSYDAIVTGKVSFWPIEATLDNYRQLLKGTRVVQGLVNNVILTVVGTLLSLGMTILAAYPLSRGYCYGRRFFTLAIIFTMLFQGGLIPSFMLIKNLDLMNTYWSLWLPGIVSTYNMLIMRTFFEQIPEEMIESAQIDGSGEWRILLHLILPLSKPVLATLGLFYAVHYWNLFLPVLLYITESEKINLTVMVQQMIQSTQLIALLGQDSANIDIMLTPAGIKSAGILVLVLPLMMVYPFLQKYFVKGVMLGAVKG
ncbi:binding-protein-dependent transport systems inner membrane component [Paenibacillus algicola]|uniref:Binding-protein-dependent transport systems inner membrane component n=1 Tax=Paenibacillus algicola TaxID=2565926 RepID=A0A4V1G3Q7_9BACL|nr:carbohydrate ABC transporter permease [Paenibacillus algicola]QCT02034.1 binding-protein-dependent transport systems inner membrane component [Paenibacillus algicola]